MKNLEEIRNNGEKTIKAIVHFMQTRTNFNSRIISLDITKLEFLRSPHDLDGYEYSFIVKFYKDIGHVDAGYLGNIVNKLEENIISTIKDMSLDKNGFLRVSDNAYMDDDNIFIINEVNYVRDRDYSLHVTYEFIINLYLHEN